MIKHNLVPRVLRTWDRGCIKTGTRWDIQKPRILSPTSRGVHLLDETFLLVFDILLFSVSGYQMKHSFSCSIYHFFFGKQGMAQWWERSLPTNVARVQIPTSTPYVGWVCCWFSPLLREVFLRVLRFSPLLKNQHFQIPIRPGIR